MDVRDYYEEEIFRQAKESYKFTPLEVHTVGNADDSGTLFLTGFAVNQSIFLQDRWTG